MSRSRVLRHGYLTRSNYQPFLVSTRALPCLRQNHNHVHDRHVPSDAPKINRKYERDTHSPKEYVIFAVLLGSIGSYAVYERLNRDPASSKSQTPLNDRTFVPFLLVAKEPLSSTGSIYTLRRGSSLNRDPYGHLWSTNGEVKISSVEFKQPQLQIARAYTPLPPTKGTDPTDLRFLIRKEKGGEVSNYLDRLRIGATVEIRGPTIEWQTTDLPDDLVFLAGGTGIAPAMQVARAFMGNKQRKDGQRRPRMHILWANRRREDCVGGVTKGTGRIWWWPFSGTSIPSNAPPNVLVKELEEMVAEGEGDFTVDYLVDEENTFIDQRRILQSISGRKDLEKTAIGAKLLLISGPDGFVEHLAGPKTIEGGAQSPGLVGGVLGQLGLRLWTVVKL